MGRILHISMLGLMLSALMGISAKAANLKIGNNFDQDYLEQNIVIDKLESGSDSQKPPLGATPINTQDSLALVDLYNATGGASWTNHLFWLIGPVSTWFGVVVSSERVTNIDLKNNNLTGTIPTSIGNLTGTNILNLSGNNLTGEIPVEVGNMVELWELYLQNNELTGGIPSTLSNISMLYQLYVYNNQLSGTLPDDLADIAYLMYINISGNQFNGAVPSGLGSLEYLTELDIKNNKFISRDIEPIFSWNNYNTFSPLFSYADQAEVGTGDTLTVSEGASIKVNIPGYTPGDYDEFQWYINNNILSGETDSVINITAATPGNAGNYQCEITNTVATALTLYSKNFKVEISSSNTPPIANAGTDQIVDERTLVTLDGSASSDADSDPLTYSWTAPTEITLSNNTAASPTFTAPEVSTNTQYEFILVVNDGTVNSTPDTVVITVNQVNKIPVANAGTDQTAEEGTLVTLNGSASSDADNNPLTYVWTAPVEITLSDNTAVSPTFTAPEVSDNTEFEIILVVNDGTVNSAPDTIVITVTNAASVPASLSVQNETVGIGESNCYDALQTITVAGSETTVSFESGSLVDLIAGESITFLPGFHASSGSNVHAYISTTDFCTPASSVVMARTEEKAVDINLPDNSGIAKTEKVVKLYPNPTTGKVTIDLINYEQPAALTIYNLQGRSVAASKVSQSTLLDLDYLQKGLYIVKVESAGVVKTQKLMIE